MSEKKTVEERLGVIEERLNHVCDNELPHLERAIARVEAWVLTIFGSVLLTIIGLVLHHFLTANPQGIAQAIVKAALRLM